MPYIIPANAPNSVEVAAAATATGTAFGLLLERLFCIDVNNNDLVLDAGNDWCCRS